ncbi:MAG: alpha/beta hydrolase [Marinomonas sp.]
MANISPSLALPFKTTAASLLALSLAACGGEDAPSAGSVAVTPTPSPTPTPTPAPTPTPRLLADIEYTSAATDNGAMPLLLDIYQPDTACAANRPTVVFVHGGSFITGNKDTANSRLLAEAINARGFNFISIQYRLQGDAPILSAPFADVRDDLIAATGGQAGPRSNAIGAAFEGTVTALNFLQANSDTYCADMSKLALWGSSAGSLTVMQVAYGLNQFGIARPEPSVVMNYWGGLLRDSDLEAGEAPFFTLHGTADSVVDYQEALDLSAQAAAVGVEHSQYSIIGADHAFSAINIETVNVGGTSLLELSSDFVEAHLTGTAPLYTTVDVTP